MTDIDNIRLFQKGKDEAKYYPTGRPAVDFLRSALENGTSDDSRSGIEDRIGRMEDAISRLLCRLFAENKLTSNEVMEIVGFAEWEYDDKGMYLTKVEE